MLEEEKCLLSNEDIDEKLAMLQRTFASDRTKSLQWRKDQLRAFIRGMTEMREEILNGWVEDHGRHSFNGELADYILLIEMARK
jgi:aldehyde dehydrogenase (NAD+)